MADTESDEPVVAGTVPVPIEFFEPYADQPFSPTHLTIRIPPVGALDPGETPPADPPETATEGGNDA